MSKKTTFIILIFLLVILIVGFIIIFGKIGPQSDGGEGESGGNFLTNLLPFGDGGGSDNDVRPNVVDGNQNGGGGFQNITNSGQSLQQLTKVAIAGYTATTTENGLTVRYMERSTGNIFDINMNSLNVGRITNKTLPGVHELVWNDNSDAFVARYVDENDVIKTYQAKITQNSTSSPVEVKSIDGFFLEDGITFLTTDPTNSKFVYLSPNKLGAYGTISSFEAEGSEIIFESDFGEWILNWNNNDSMLATTKASYAAKGFAYEVDIDTGKFTKIFGDDYSFMTLPNDTNDRILYSKTDSKSVAPLSLFENGKTTSLILPTLTEKCTWNTKRHSIVYCGIPLKLQDAEYPDMWYQGVITFVDSIVEIDTENISINLLSTPGETFGETIDAIDLHVDEEGKYLFFTNKKDSTLWRLELEQPVEEVVNEVVEGEPL